MGYQDLIMAVPPILINQLQITDPIVSNLGDARMYGSNDPTYGAIGYIPRLDGIPFAMLNTDSVIDDDTVETNRIWATYTLSIFIAIQHADTPSVANDYHLVAMGYLEQMRQLVPANRRLLPYSNYLFPTAGDVRWSMRNGRVSDRHNILGIPFYGVDIKTQLLIVEAVRYQG